MSTTKDCKSVSEWQKTVTWPPTEEDMQVLDTLLSNAQKQVRTLGRQLGIPEEALLWVTKFEGKNECGNWIFRGLAPWHWDAGSFERAASQQKLGWLWRHDWSDGLFRVVAIQVEHRLIITYCEGDITLSFGPDRASFDAELNYANEFYLNH